MHFFLKLAVVVMVVCSVCAYSSYQPGTEYFKPAPGALHLSGNTFLSLFPHKPVPYDDYAVVVHYYEVEKQDIVNIAFWGEADDFFPLRKRIRAGDNKIEFFDIIDARTSDEIGFGSCSYRGSNKTSCEYLFEAEAFGEPSRIKAIIDLRENSFRSYIFPLNGEEALEVSAKNLE